MAQRSWGPWRALSQPRVYDGVQSAFGVKHFRQVVMGEYVKPGDVDCVVDIGCGTGEFLPYFPKGNNYFGFDLSSDYIASAKRRFGDRATFECAGVSEWSANEFSQSIDVVLAIGVIHHLDDTEATSLIASARACLREGGRLVTVDPTITSEGQSWASRALVSLDRGLHVRDPGGYFRLSQGSFTDVQTTVRHDLLRLPYSHCVTISHK